MLKRNSIFKCALCGNTIEVLNVGGGTITCCGQDMDFLAETTADTSLEKHVPYIQKTTNGYLVKVGEKQDHPMLDAHYIVWIELNTDQIISSIVRSREEWDSPRYSVVPLHRNIEREGISI